VAKRNVVNVAASTNGQPCVPCAQSGCASVLSVTSSVKAAEFGKAITNGPEVIQKAFDHVGPRAASGIPSGTSFKLVQRRFRESGDIWGSDDGLAARLRIVMQHVSISSFAVPDGEPEPPTKGRAWRVMSADSPYPKPLASMVRFGGVGGFLFYPSVQVRKCRPAPRLFASRQTFMPEFDQPPFCTDISRRHR